MSGKGSTPRPKSVPESDYAERWTRTFCPPLRDPVTAPDTREAMRQANLAEAMRVILGTPCATDWPARDHIPHTDPDSDAP